MTDQLKIRRAALAAALSLTALLAACGGGGGGGSTAPAVGTPTASASTPAAPASTPAPAAFPTAAVLTQQAYDRLTALQKDVGITLVSQVPQDINPALNLAAKNHLAYMFTNKAFTSGEDMSLPGSTGATAGAQAQAAGYPVDQNGVSGQEFAAVPPGVTGDQWIDAILSTGTGAAFLLPNGEFGLAFAPWPNATNPTAMGGLVNAGWNPIDLMSGTGTNNGLFLYPYNGQTNVPPTNLVPDFPGSTIPFFAGDAAGSHGAPISFIVGSNAFVQITSAVLKDAQGNVVPTTIYCATTDPQTLRPNGATAPGWVAGRGLVMPTTPLKPNATYTLTWSATYGQIPATPTTFFVGYTPSGTLTFTTGSQTPFKPNALF